MSQKNMNDLYNSNEVISIFMGGEKLDPSLHIPDETQNKQLWVEIVKRKMETEIPPYNQSWDWLMPVWKRFLKEIHFNLSDRNIREEYKMRKTLISDAIYACCIETTYKQLVNAIEWANVVGFTEIYEE